MRRATDSDMHPVTSFSQHPFTSSSQHPVRSRVLAAIGQPSSVSPKQSQASQHSSHDTQPLGAAKVQRSLTWTEEGPAGVRWGTEQESGGNPTMELEGHSGSKSMRVTRSNVSDSTSGIADTTTQQQQQQQHSLLGVNVQVSTTLEEATSSQCSPKVQPSRHGAVLHRQRLASNAAAGVQESQSGSSNIGQVPVPAGFRAGTPALLCDAK